MTQVKEMTDQQLNRELAELMGYKVVDLDPEWFKTSRKYVLVEPEERQQLIRRSEDEAWEDAPDYCTDPAASLEVQAKAIEVDHESYLFNLMDVVYGGYVAASSERIAGLLTASPRERAEAAYITLQGAT